MILLQHTWKKPFSYDIIFIAQYTFATVKNFIKLIIRVSKVVETIFPNAHISERAERFVVRRDPIGTVKNTIG